MRSALLLCVYLSLLCLAAYLTDRCLLRWARLADSAGNLRKYWLPAILLLSAQPVAGAFLPNGPAKNALQAAGNIWLGFFLYFGLILLSLLLLSRALGLVSGGRLARGWHGGILCVSAALALAVGGYGLVHAQQTVVTCYELTLDKPGEDMTLVLIGDLHLSVNSRLSATRRMVELINAEQPDLVAVAGDVFTSSYDGLSQPEAYAEALRGIRSKYGVYAVYGNHDVEETLFGGFPVTPISQAFRSPQMEQFFMDSGFIPLTDDVVTLDNGVQLAGRVDGEKAGDGTKDRLTPAELLSGADRRRPILVLEHEPKEFEALAEAGADVALCGHTHNGQVFPGNLLIPLFNENAWGYKRLHGLDTFVTAGTGYYGPPMRVGTNSEITVIRLHFAGRTENTT